MPDGAAEVPAVRARVHWAGHSTVLVRLPGLTFLTDPFFRSRLGPLRRHGPRPDPAALPAPDVVLISHAHPDHFDPRSLREVAGRPLVVVPKGMGRRVSQIRRPPDGWDGIVELGVGESVSVAGARWRVTATPARHWRSPAHPDVRAVGFLVEGPLNVYFAGDTSAFAAMSELAGRVDVALLPIGRWGPQPTPGHLTPATAARVAATTGARVVVPIHWGTLYPLGLGRLIPGPLRQPGERFARACAELAPGVDVRLLEPGQAADLELPVRRLEISR